MGNQYRFFLLLVMQLVLAVCAYAQTNIWTLSRCIDTSIANNLNLQISRNAIEAGRLNFKQSKDNLLPAVNGNVAEALNMARKVDPLTSKYVAGVGTNWNTTFGIGLEQNIFSGLQFLNTIKQNELIYKSYELDLEDQKFNLTISVLNNYLQILYAAQAFKVAQNQLGVDSEQLRITADLAYVGKKTESDVQAIKAQLAADNYTVTSTLNQVRIAKVNLQQLMNIVVAEGFEIDYSIPVSFLTQTNESAANVFMQSLSFQPVVQSYNLKTQGAVYALKAAKGGFYPQIYFKAGLNTSYASLARQIATTTTSTVQNIGFLQNDPSQLVSGDVVRQQSSVNTYLAGNQFRDNLTGVLSIGMTVPIINYMQVRNNVKKQQINLSNARINEQNIRITLRKSIEQVYANAENSIAQYQSANSEVEAAKASYNIALAKYSEGKMVVSDLVIQENIYNKAQLDLLQARYGLIFNLKILDYYNGIPISL